MVDIEPIVFSEEDIVPVEIPVTIGKEHFVLREASGDAAVKFQNARMNRLTIGENGKPSSFKNMGDLEPYLVSLCLFTAKRKEPKLDNILVPEVEIRSWKSHIQKKLFDTAKKISHIDDEVDTVESLEKTIADCQKKIEELKKGSSSKNLPDDGEAGSA